MSDTQKKIFKPFKKDNGREEFDRLMDSLPSEKRRAFYIGLAADALGRFLSWPRNVFLRCKNAIRAKFLI